jgi:hypothetical protein
MNEKFIHFLRQLHPGRPDPFGVEQSLVPVSSTDVV